MVSTLRTGKARIVLLHRAIRAAASESAMLHQLYGRVRAAPPLVTNGAAPNLEPGNYSGFPDDR